MRCAWAIVALPSLLGCVPSGGTPERSRGTPTVPSLPTASAAAPCALATQEALPGEPAAPHSEFRAAEIPPDRRPLAGDYEVLVLMRDCEAARDESSRDGALGRLESYVGPRRLDPALADRLRHGVRLLEATAIADEIHLTVLMADRTTETRDLCIRAMRAGPALRVRQIGAGLLGLHRDATARQAIRDQLAVERDPGVMRFELGWFQTISGFGKLDPLMEEEDYERIRAIVQSPGLSAEILQRCVHLLRPDVPEERALLLKLLPSAPARAGRACFMTLAAGAWGADMEAVALRLLQADEGEFTPFDALLLLRYRGFPRVRKESPAVAEAVRQIAAGGGPFATAAAYLMHPTLPGSGPPWLPRSKADLRQGE